MTKFALEIEDTRMIICDTKKEAIQRLQEIFNFFIEDISKERPNEGYHLSFPNLSFIHLSETDMKRLVIPGSQMNNFVLEEYKFKTMH